MKKNCDMHIHTNYSDGNLSGTELLQYAKKKNLKKLSITDHDCVDFYLDENVIDMLKDFEYIPGCEFVCCYDDVPIEILGYGIDIKKAKEYLDIYGISENRMERYRSDNIPKVFSKHGVDLAYSPEMIDFTKKCPMVLETIHEIILKNPEAVKFLNEENQNLTKSVSRFLREGLNNPNSKIFIDPNKLYPSYKKITSLIKKLGGLSFLAHPYQYGDKMGEVLEGIKQYVDGVECYHYTTREEGRSEYLKAFCKKNDLLISGGSDFHIYDPNGGDSLNDLDIPEEHFDQIKIRLNQKTRN